MKRFIILLALAVPCMAADNEVTLNLGGGFPVSNIENPATGNTVKIGSSGIAGGANYIRKLAPQIGVGIDALFSAYGEQTSDTVIGGAHSTISTKPTVLLAIGKFWIPQLPVKPYLLAGIGFHNSHVNATATPLPGFGWIDTGTAETRTIIDQSETGFASAVGVGLSIPIIQAFSIGFEARYQYLGNVTYDTQNLPVNGQIKGDASSFNMLANATIAF